MRHQSIIKRNYVYIFLDPTRPTKLECNNIGFLFEPFYVGKGSRDRDKSHFWPSRRKIDKSNPIKYLRLDEIKNAGEEPIIIRLKEHMTAKSALSLERKLIRIIGKVEDGSGPLLNKKTGSNK
ncbi:MAG: hypothetical protein KAS32_17210 [Candidatus Peribacteraceae bacterium]|nr:hypothetical protein [Candidatus Peribacteraceae bacterium]